MVSLFCRLLADRHGRPGLVKCQFPAARLRTLRLNAPIPVVGRDGCVAIHEVVGDKPLAESPAARRWVDDAVCHLPRNRCGTRLVVVRHHVDNTGAELRITFLLSFSPVGTVVAPVEYHVVSVVRVPATQGETGDSGCCGARAGCGDTCCSWLDPQIPPNPWAPFSWFDWYRLSAMRLHWTVTFSP